MARVTGLEPATSGVTGRHSNQLSYTRTFPCRSTLADRRERSFREAPLPCQAHKLPFFKEKPIRCLLVYIAFGPAELLQVRCAQIRVCRQYELINLRRRN